MKNKMMLTVLMFVGWFFMSSSWAADIGSYKNNYTVNESVLIQLENKPGNVQDWIGIYHAGASNDWGNVVSWVWANDPSVVNGVPAGDWYKFKNTSLNNYAGAGDYSNYAVQLPAGNYEARFFLNNSFNMEAQNAFSVHVDSPIKLTLDKQTYETNDQFVVNYTGMSGDEQDWFGIYKKGDTNDWANQHGWTWSGGSVNGSASIEIENLAAGDYEVRAFFNNTFDLEEVVSFTIAGSTQLTLDKQTYAVNDTLTVNYSGMSGDDQDWLGIYKKGDTNDWANQRGWTWSAGTVNGSVSLEIDNLPAGDYEVRAFFNNTFNDEAIASFVVKEFWEKGEYQVEVTNLPNNKGTVYSPVGLAGDLPVVFFTYGGNSSDHAKYHQTVLSFIASRGYHAVLVTKEFGGVTATQAADKYHDAVTELQILKGVNKQKIGIVGHSSGGGEVFRILKMLKEKHNFANDKSFVLAIDPWFAVEMNQQDLKDFPENTNTLILQFGLQGNNMKANVEGDNFSTDGTIAATLFKYLNENYPNNVDYKIFKGVGDDRGHKYLYDDITEENKNNRGNNYERMKGGLEPLGALMDFTFQANLKAKNKALENNQRDNQYIFKQSSYQFECVENRYPRFFTDGNGKLNGTDVNYCDVQRSE